jgi:hypothetical protein
MWWCADPSRLESKYKLRLSLEMAGRSLSHVKLAHAELTVAPRLTGGPQGPNLSRAVDGTADAAIASAAAVTSNDAFMTLPTVRDSGNRMCLIPPPSFADEPALLVR